MHSDPVEANEIRRFEEQYAENPESFVFARLADAHRKAGNLERALEILEKGLARHPEYLSAHIVHAKSLMELERVEEAAAAWRSVLELDPQNLVALRRLAEAALAAGDRPTAREWAERLLHVDPLNNEAADLVAMTAPDIPAAVPAGGEAADGEAEEEGEADQEVGMVTETMADLYLQQGLYEEAAEIYWELVKRHPADPRLRERLAQAQALSSGETDVAAEPEVMPLVLERSAPEPESQVTGSEAGLSGGEPAAPAGEQESRQESPPVAEPEDIEPEPPSKPGEAEAGIRAHLQALICGRAPVERPLYGEGGDAGEAAGERLSGVTEPSPEGATTSFGEWLSSRGR